MVRIPGSRRFERVVRSRNVKAVLELVVVGICTVAFALNAAGICATLLTANYACQRDFVTYWSSGHQLAQGSNPYDRAAIFELERSAGYSSSQPPLIMRNLPFSLPLVLPLGFLGIRAASLLWSALMLTSLVFSVRMLAAIHGRSKSPLNYLAYTFAPVLSCLIAGQMALFVLLGLVLFLRLHTTRPLLAGAALWLCALKPHLFLPFGVVLLGWILVTRSFKVLLGATFAFCASLLAVALIDPLVWPHYSQMMRSANLDTAFIPCLSTMFRLAIRPGSLWPQYLPAFLGCIWAIFYFRKHSEEWDWIQHGSLLMLISVVVAPYSWFMDQATLLPALLHALYRNRSRKVVAVLALLSACIEIANFKGVPVRSPFLYPWTALVWLAWYLYTVHKTRLIKGKSDPESTGVSLAVQGRV